MEWAEGANSRMALRPKEDAHGALGGAVWWLWYTPRDTTKETSTQAATGHRAYVLCEGQATRRALASSLSDTYQTEETREEARREAPLFLISKPTRFKRENAVDSACVCVHLPFARYSKSSQVANFQIGTNKCAMQRAQPSKKESTPQAARALIEAEVAWDSSDIRHRLD